MKLKFYISIILFFLILSQLETGNAQSPNWVWAKGMGDSNGDGGSKVITDGSGFIYVTGNFKGTADFDPGPTIFNLTSVGSVNNDIYILKLDASGNFVWALSMGGSDIDVGIALAIDTAGNIYTSGYFEGTADFDPGIGTFNLTAPIGGGVFISKLNNSGNFIWAKAFIGQTASGFTGNSIVVGNSGCVYTVGRFVGTSDFDPGAGVFNLTSPTNTYDIFISKLDNQGNFVWAKQLGGTDDDQGNSIVIDVSENIYTTGFFNGTADFDPGAAVYNLTAGWADVFISKLDSSGNFIWANSMGGTMDDRGYSIRLDASNNIYTTGSFFGVADFDPGAAIYSLTSAGGGDMFISKLDASGNFIWAKGIGGTLYDQGNSIKVDASGNVYTTGFFQDIVDFDPNAGVYELSTNNTDFDIFVSKLDASGNFIWATSAGGTTDDSGSSVALNASNNVIVTGSFQSPVVTFGANTLTNINQSGYSSDIFIAKLDNVTGVNNLSNENDISICPNPATDNFTIAFKNIGKPIIITITDIAGKIIYKTTSVNLPSVEVSTKDFSAGIYVIKIQAGEFIETKRLTVGR